MAENETNEMTPQQQDRINREIVRASSEAQALANKKNISKQEARKLDVLLSRIASLKSGFDLTDVMVAEHNIEERRQGLPVTQFRDIREVTPESRDINQFLRTGNVESRTESVGSPVYVNTTGNVASLVPVSFFNKVVRTMKQHSPLYDEDVCTVLKTKSGNPIQVPWISDIESVAEVINEGATDSGSTDINSVSGAHVVTFAYRTPRIKFSMEADQDVNLDFLLDILGDRLARGAGADLTVGDGSNKPLGLVPSVLALGAVVTAAGSAANSGGAENGTNSIGSTDIANLFFSIPKPYRNSSKFGFMMNSDTALHLSTRLDKSGRPLLNINKELMLHGKQVLICDEMDDIGASKTPIVAGDFSYWLSRIAVGTMYVNRYWQGPGLAENGIIAINMFGRVGGQLMYSDTSAPSPIWALSNHS